MTNLFESVKNAMSSTDTVEALLMTRTKVATAAAFKHLNIEKHSAVNVTLNAKSVYKDEVINSALKNDGNDATKIDAIVEFKPQASTYLHEDTCYCLATHPKTAQQYLYCTLNSSSSTYYIDGKEVAKEDVLEYLTASVRKSWEEKSTHNVGNDFDHDVKPLTYKLSSIQSIQILATGEVIKNTEFAI